MIIEAMVGLIVGVLGAVLGSVPAGPIVLPVSSSPIFPYFATFNRALPLTDFIAGMSLLLGVWGVVFAVGLVRWVYGMIPLKGT